MDSSIKLSVLICTVAGREKLFEKLYTELAKQAYEKPVQILFEKDNKEISVGRKRQNLLEKAAGEYVVFVDDDDFVSADYVDSILEALAEGPDCVGFLIDCKIDGKKASAISSLKYKAWGENIDGFTYVRSIYHKTPVKRSIALQVGFPDLRFGEDHPYSMGVTKICKTEIFIPKILYYYRYTWANNKEKYGIK